MRGYRQRMASLRAERDLGETRRDAFFAMLGESERPLIYAGGGVINGNGADAAARVRARASAFRSSRR